MDSDLNSYYVTFEVYKDNVKVHSLECPRSFIQTQFPIWVYPGSPYMLKVIDHTGNFRVSSDIFFR